MLHNWSALYHKQIQSGEDYENLEPVIAIWLLTKNLFDELQDYHFHFQAWEAEKQLKLSEHLSIHVFELDKWHKPEALQPIDYWLYLLREGKEFFSLPRELRSIPQMRQVMSVLKDISESQEDYYRYLARQEYLWVKNSEEKERQRLLVEKEKLTQDKKQLTQDNEQLAQDNEQLTQALNTAHQQQLNTASKMLESGLSLEQVVQMTGLSEQQVRQIM